MAELIKAGEFVGPGEERTALYLEQHLPSTWVVVCNKELISPVGGVREADFIVIGDHSVFMIEEKNWHGPIHGNENGWVLSSGESFNSPLSTVFNLSRRLAGILKQHDARLKNEVVGHFVHPRVIVSPRDAQLFVHDPRVNDCVLHLEGCEEELIRSDRLQPQSGSISRFRASIKERLTGLRDRPKIPRSVGDYTIIEDLPSLGENRCFRGRHPDGSERILKVIPRVVTADVARTEAHENVILREYAALNLLADTKRVPHADPYFSWGDNDYVVIPIWPVPGHSLRADRANAAPDEERIVSVVLDAFRALETLTDHDVIHRQISPNRVHLEHNRSVVFSDFILARIGGQQTISGDDIDIDPEDAYRSPECIVDLALADPRSDVYSLAGSLYYWITGFEITDQAERMAVAMARPDLSDSCHDLLEKLFGACLAVDERDRPLVQDVVQELAHTSRNEEVPSREHATSAELTPGTIVANQYKVIRLLGEGATASTYLAEDLVADALFVLKRIRNPELIGLLARNEFRSLLGLNHRNLPRVYDVRPANDPFHLKLEYIRGSTLSQVAVQRRNDPIFFFSLASQLLSALSYLEASGFIHRDVSPTNILVADEEAGPIKLIDFGLAIGRDGSVSAVGTPLYRAPEIDRQGEWSAKCDQYSAAVVLFELLTGELPYRMVEGNPRKDRLLNPEDTNNPFGDSPIIQVLLKAASPDASARYESTSSFAAAVQESRISGVAPQVTGARLINPFVDSLRSAYRNSRSGNAENRGLDSEFSRSTYVKTNLDTELLPRILSGALQLVVLSGNPGDGKTAFLQAVRDELLNDGARVRRDDAAGWLFAHNDHEFAALYDASESDGDASSDDLLHSVLGPLAGEQAPVVHYTAAIAVNDGRLLEFFERFGEQRYGWIWNDIRSQLFSDDTVKPSAVLVIDLKNRALVKLKYDGTSILDGIVDQFVAPSNWSVCNGCIARHECPIRFNALSLGDHALGDTVRPRLHDTVLAVHLRRERDLRSALAYYVGSIFSKTIRLVEHRSLAGLSMKVEKSFQPGVWNRSRIKLGPLIEQQVWRSCRRRVCRSVWPRDCHWWCTAI